MRSWGLARQAGELVLSALEVEEEERVRVEVSDGGGGSEATGVDITLPVSADDDAALAVGVATGENLSGVVWVDLGEEEGAAPASDSVAGGVGAVLAEVGVVGGDECRLVEAVEGSLAHIVLLREGRNLVGSVDSADHQFPDLGSVHLRNLEAEGGAEDLEDIFRSPVSIFGSHAGADRVEAHLLAPEVLGYVVGEGGA